MASTANFSPAIAMDGQSFTRGRRLRRRYLFPVGGPFVDRRGNQRGERTLHTGSSAARSAGNILLPSCRASYCRDRRLAKGLRVQIIPPGGRRSSCSWLRRSRRATFLNCPAVCLGRDRVKARIASNCRHKRLGSFVLAPRKFHRRCNSQKHPLQGLKPPVVARSEKASVGQFVCSVHRANTGKIVYSHQCAIRSEHVACFKGQEKRRVKKNSNPSSPPSSSIYAGRFDLGQ